MTKRTPPRRTFPRVQRRRVEASFDGGDITSDGGAVLLREVERHLGLLRRVTRYIADPRRTASCDHEFGAILKQRVFGLALVPNDNYSSPLTTTTFPHSSV